LISDIQVQIQNAVNMTAQADSQTHLTLDLVGESESELDSLSRESEKLSEVFMSISTVLIKQDECMSRVLSGIQEISSSSDVNSESAHSAADLADALEGRASELKSSVQQFKVSAG
jgi:methyl-accepting chemotaxis protein